MSFSEKWIEREETVSRARRDVSPVRSFLQSTAHKKLERYQHYRPRNRRVASDMTSETTGHYGDGKIAARY